MRHYVNGSKESNNLRACCAMHSWECTAVPLGIHYPWYLQYKFWGILKTSLFNFWEDSDSSALLSFLSLVFSEQQWAVSTVVLAYQLPHLDNSTTEWQKPMMHNPTLMADTVGQHFDGQYWQPTVMACTSLDLILSAVNRPSKMTADMAWTLSGQYRLMCCRLRTTATQHLNNCCIWQAKSDNFRFCNNAFDMAAMQ